MSHIPQVAPSLLAADLSRLGEEIAAVEAAGADLLHLDVMDGHFVPNISFGFPVIESIRKKTKLPLDTHLMIADPDKYLEECSRVGCNWVSVHVEVCQHLNRTLQRIRDLGMKAGVAINPGTSLAALDAVLDEMDFVLIMSVNPGFGGQKFIDGAFERVKELKKKIGSRNVKIEIDGGIKEANSAKAVAAGVDVLVVGTGLFGTKDYKKTIAALKGS